MEAPLFQPAVPRAGCFPSHLVLEAVGCGPCFLHSGLGDAQAQSLQPSHLGLGPLCKQELMLVQPLPASAFTQSLRVDILVWLLPVCGMELPEGAGYPLSPGPQTSPFTPSFILSRPQAASSELWVLTSPKAVQEAGARWVPRCGGDPNTGLDCLGARTQILDSVP